MWHWRGPIGVWLSKNEKYWGLRVGNWKTPIVTLGLGILDIGLALRMQEATRVRSLIVRSKQRLKRTNQKALA